MRNIATRSAALGMVVLGVLASSPARADVDVAGTFEVKFEQVSTNCEQPVNYPASGTIKIEPKGGDLQVDIARTPIMVGKPTKTGKLSAKSPKPGHTPVQGMDGVFSVAGRITGDGMLSLVMVGEYQVAGKPLCTQSWNLSGLRGGRSKPEPAKPEKKR